MPDRASVAVKPTVTGPVYQPLAPTLPALTAAVLVGAVLSSLTVTESVPVLPARSFAEPFTTRPVAAVSVETVTSGVTVAASTPEPPSSSLASKWTVVSALFQPAALAAGSTVWVTVGAMLSNFRATPLSGSALPALSTAKYSTLARPLLAASGTFTSRAGAGGDLLRTAVDRVADLLDAGQASLVGSRRVTVAWLRHQPFVPSQTLFALVSGAWLSMLMPVTVVEAVLSALSVADPVEL